MIYKLKVNQKTYNQSCTATFECKQSTNLICSSVATQSNCPQTLSSNKCDCLYSQFYDATLGCGKLRINLFF